MLGDLPQNARYVRRLPCEDILICALEVSELAFLFGQELGPDSHRPGQVGGVDLHHLGFLGRMEGTQGGWPVAVGDCWSRQIPKF